MKEVHLFMKDNGSVINTDAETTIIISLDGNPTTGFGWALDSMDQNVVQNIQSKYKKTESTAMGSGGEFIFILSSLKQGSSKISFKYWKHWEGDSSVTNRFEIQLNVA
ncbi:MAG: protease inhibitor I42 family protein [Chitinophagaceae bacterium]